MTSILLIDDHPLARSGIGAWLEQTGRFTVVGEAAALGQAQSLLETARPFPDLVILDISLGQENGLTFIDGIIKAAEQRNEKRPLILVCSMYADPFLAHSAIEDGADGYISKSADMGELLTAIDTILDGGTYIDKKCETHSGGKTYGALTRREREILQLLKRSLNNQQIAEIMRVSVRTVENHLAHIYFKTGTASRRELFEM